MTTDRATFSLIAAERRRLADALEELGDAEWEQPSLCEGWTVHDVAAHLNAPWALKLTDIGKAMLSKRGNFAAANGQMSRDLAARMSPAACIAGLRANAEHRFTPPGAGPEAPLTDAIVHGADMLRPLGRAAAVDPAALAVVLDWLSKGRARGFFPARRIEGLSFDATDVSLRCGSGNAVVRGPALSLCGAILGRRAYLDDLEGSGADVLAHRI
ncbi:MAG: maleylpyruvate isomerase family mycothiol-dependent enzyme [Acidimicrobiales bacterium]